MLQKKFIHHDSMEVQKQAILITYYLDYLGIHLWGLNHKNKHRNEQQKKEKKIRMDGAEKGCKKGYTGNFKEYKW